MEDMIKRIRQWLKKPGRPISLKRFVSAAFGSLCGVVVFFLICVFMYMVVFEFVGLAPRSATKNSIADFLGFYDEGDLTYRNLDYDVHILKNGDMRVVQHLDVSIGGDDDNNKKPWKQLYQRYTLKSNNLNAITDVSVRNVTEGKTYKPIAPTRPDEVRYDQDWDDKYAGHWYIADVSSERHPVDYLKAQKRYGSDGPLECNELLKWEIHQECRVDKQAEEPLEIGWNIPTTDYEGSLKFDISMTFKGVATLHPDVAKLQWEPVGDDNAIAIKQVSGTVHLPQGATAENSWSWIHYRGKSFLERSKDGTIRFSAAHIHPHTHLDLVAMYDSKVAGAIVRTDSSKSKRQTIDAEDYQELQGKQDKERAALLAVPIIIVGALAALIALVLAVRTNIKAMYWRHVDYQRDLPGISPVCASELCGIVDGYRSSDQAIAARDVTATLLSLASKKAIGLYPGNAEIYRDFDLTSASLPGVALWFQEHQSERRMQDRKGNGISTIAILPVCQQNRESLRLCKSEESMLRLLENVQSRQGEVFDTSDLRYCLDDADNRSLGHFYDDIDDEFDGMHFAKSSYGNLNIYFWVASAAAIVQAICLALAQMPVLAREIAFALVFVVYFAVSVLVERSMTSQGQNKVGKVLGLRKYLEDFSDFSDRDASDLALWGRYLVYAVAVGLSPKAVDRLSLCLPSVDRVDWGDREDDSVLYWACGGYADSAGYSGVMQGSIGDFVSMLASVVVQIDGTSAGTSSSDSGGGFSDGGGSGGGTFGGR